MFKYYLSVYLFFSCKGLYYLLVEDPPERELPPPE